jgi:UPF0755 protein
VKGNNKSAIVGFATGALLLLAMCSACLAYHLYKESDYIAKKNFILDHTDENSLAGVLVGKRISDNFTITKFLIKITKFFKKYSIKVGEYALPDRVSLADALKIIDSGKVVIHKITIPEGFSVLQFMNRLNKNEDLFGDVTEVPPEGSLLPDTYCFKYPTPKQEIIVQAQKAMQSFLQKEWPGRSAKCTLKTPEEALILASIVEKETNIEKELVAGVYFRRLKIKMKLQSCPTVIYAHKRGDRLDHPLKYSELTIADPYNTYVYDGLPPTPIANPGRDSIMAVLHPYETDNLFFVYEGGGRHAFAKTYEEHKRNIARVRHVNVANVK